MELRHLRYVTAVAAHGSFNKAAQLLHVTPPALSRQVKDVEDEIGVALLVRSVNVTTFTPTSELFYKDACDVIARDRSATDRRRRERKFSPANAWARALYPCPAQGIFVNDDLSLSPGFVARLQ